MKLYVSKSDRIALMALWQPRIGLKAAKFYVGARFWIALVPGFGIAYFCLVFLKHTFASATLLSWIILALGIATVIASFSLLFLAWHAAGRALGIKIGLQSFPPSGPISYERWCAEHLIAPYEGDRAPLDHGPDHGKSG